MALTLEDIYRDMTGISPFVSKSARKRVLAAIPGALARRTAASYGADAGMFQAAMRKAGLENVAGIRGKTARDVTERRQTGATYRKNLEIAGDKLLRQMMETGAYSRLGLKGEIGSELSDQEHRQKKSVLEQYGDMFKGGRLPEGSDVNKLIGSHIPFESGQDTITRHKKKRLPEDEKVDYFANPF
jgi:hypothetical protein